MNDAVFSSCGLYRHLLVRGEAPYCGIVGCNPSIAGVTKPDPTSTRLIGFAKDWGYSGYLLANVSDFISTDPKGYRMQRAVDRVSPHNAAYLALVATMPLCVVAWGGDALAEDVTVALATLRVHARALYCLGTTQAGAPRHPLYLSYREKLQRW